MSYFGLAMIGFIVGLSGAILPGPMLVYAVSEVLRGRRASALLIVLGHIFVEAVMVALLLLGLKQIIGSKIIFNILTILGAGVIISMGMHIFFRASQMKLSIKRNINFSSGLIIGGMFFTAFNPTFPTWWVSIGAVLLSRALLLGALGVIVFILGHWLADIAWYSLVSFVVGQGKLWLNDKKYQFIIRLLAIILVGLGLYFILQIMN
jgi:threonine/homoserine/homoserine lactone efflux protein